MGRIEKTVFISYRRTNFYTALAVYQDLTAHGYDVFFDYQSIDSGDFEKVILENIKAKAHFLVVLSPSALERCNEPADWLRREIETAIDEQRNIIPLLMEGFDFGSATTVQALTGKLEALKTYNGLRLVADYFFEAMEKLRTRYLNAALENVPLHSLSNDVKGINKTNKSAANEAALIETRQLTAEEWFERGYVFSESDNLDEAIRCYSEAIRLNPNLGIAYNNLGILLANLKQYDEAEVAFRKAIELNLPIPEAPYTNLGFLLSNENLKRYEEAEAALRKAIELNPSFSTSYLDLSGLLIALKRHEEADAALRKAIELSPSSPDVYYNSGTLLTDLKRYDEAETAFRKAIELNPFFPEAYNNLGNLLKSLQRYKEAETAYLKAIELNPSLSQAYGNLGNLLRNHYPKRQNDALTAYHKFIELDPSYSKAYYYRATILERKKNYSSAIADYEKYLKVGGTEGDDLANVKRRIKELKSKLTKKRKSAKKKSK